MLFVALGMSSRLSARDLTITTSAEGDLYDQLLEAISEDSDAFWDVTRLTVVGPVGENDMLFFLFKNLEELDLSQAVMPVFGGVTGLSELRRCVLPESTTELFYYAFANCEALTEVLMPSVTTLGMGSFYMCSSLRELRFPAGLTSGQWSIGKCPALTDIYVASVSPLPQLFYRDIEEEGMPVVTLHVPQSSVEAWRECYIDDPLVAVDGENIGPVKTLELTSKLVLREVADLDGASVCLTSKSGIDEYRRWTSGALTVDAGNTTWHMKSFDMAVNSHAFVDRYTEGYADWLGKTYAGMTRLLVKGTTLEADEISVRVSESGSSYNDHCWTFFSLPFDAWQNEADCGRSRYAIRRFDGERRANLQGDPWVKVGKDEIISAHEGYVLMRDHNDNYYDEDNEYDENFVNETSPFVFRAAATKAKLDIFCPGDATVPLQSYPSSSPYAANWNFVSNPYGCYYDISSLAEPVNVTICNSEGNYVTYSALDDDYKLASFMPFFVQCAPGLDALHFKASGRSAEEYLLPDDTYYSPRRTAPFFPGDLRDVSQRHVLNVVLSDNEHADRVRVVVNAAASEAYELNCDALKFMSDNAALPQIYVEDCGTRLSIDERPEGDGLFPLGVTIGRDGEHTISMASAPLPVVLIDRLTGECTDLTDQPYRFTASRGELRGRFVLAVGDATTSVATVLAPTPTASAAEYDISGRRIDRSAPSGTVRRGGVVISQNRKKVF